MSAAESFRAEYPVAERWRDWDQAAAARLAGCLPAEMMELLSRDGFCSYGDQLLWAADPDDLGEMVRPWLPGEKTVVPLFRTAFGDLFLWNGASVFHAAVHLSTVTPCALSARFLLDQVLVDDRYRRRVLRKPLLKQAACQAGRLEPDEMYSCRPSLAHGGDFRTSAIVREKLREGLAALADAGPVTRG